MSEPLPSSPNLTAPSFAAGPGDPEGSTTADCPVCGGVLEADGGLLLGELVDCLECASELEVTSLAPLVLAEAPMAAEDWGE